jgi:RNA polymerase sigma-70 factor (ECF subfamily)
VNEATPGPSDESNSVWSRATQLAGLYRDTGQTQHVTELYRSTTRPLYLHIYGLLGKGSMADGRADDLFQTAWEKAYPKLHTYDPQRASFRTWMFTIVRNAAIDMTRKPFVKKEEATDDAATLDCTAADEGPEERQLRLESNRETFEALNTLNTKQRTVVVDHYWSYLSFDEIASAMGEKVGNVHKLHQRAVGKLRHVMQPGQEDTFGEAHLVIVESEASEKNAEARNA